MAGGSELPGDELRQHAGKETDPDLKTRMSGEQQPRCADQPRKQQGDGDILPRAKFIGKSKQVKEHQGAAHGDGVHADLEKDIEDPAAADGEKGAEQEVDGHGWDVRQVLEDHPGPPIKSHRDDIGNDPVLFRAQEGRFDQF